MKLHLSFFMIDDLNNLPEDVEDHINEPLSYDNHLDVNDSGSPYENKDQYVDHIDPNSLHMNNNYQDELSNTEQTYSHYSSGFNSDFDVSNYEYIDHHLSVNSNSDNYVQHNHSGMVYHEHYWESKPIGANGGGSENNNALSGYGYNVSDDNNLNLSENYINKSDESNTVDVGGGSGTDDGGSGNSD
jgi:hypothetical protein